MSGTALKGHIKLNDTLLLGPDPLGQFLPIVIKSIHRKRMPVKEVRGGQTASFALKKVRYLVPACMMFILFLACCLMLSGMQVKCTSNVY